MFIFNVLLIYQFKISTNKSVHLFFLKSAPICLFLFYASDAILLVRTLCLEIFAGDSLLLLLSTYFDSLVVIEHYLVHLAMSIEYHQAEESH